MSESYAYFNPSARSCRLRLREAARSTDTARGFLLGSRVSSRLRDALRRTLLRSLFPSRLSFAVLYESKLDSSNGNEVFRPGGHLVLLPASRLVRKLVAQWASWSPSYVCTADPVVSSSFWFPLPVDGVLNLGVGGCNGVTCDWCVHTPLGVCVNTHPFIMFS